MALPIAAKLRVSLNFILTLMFSALWIVFADSGAARAAYQTSCTSWLGYPGNPTSTKTSCDLSVTDLDHIVVSNLATPLWSFVRISPPPKTFTLNGTWRSSDFTCAHVGGKITERVTIRQIGDSYVATKINGDDCVESGHVAFFGAITTAAPLAVLNPFLAPHLSSITISDVVSNLYGHASAKARRLAVDGVSAAIVAFRTPSSQAVILTASNGASLSAYDPTFLTTAPSAGLAQISVTPIKVGAAYYALATLQTLPAGAAPNYGSPITVEALQNNDVVATNIAFAPPPTLLVHGLWGSNSSLAFYQLQLRATPPWSTFPSLVQEVTYSGALNFDSSTSVDGIATATASALRTAWGQGIVVSRVDAIAHSMGGLLIRSFSDPNRATARYRGLVNRQQGWLNTIVTLDTPELGSALATYLLQQQNSTRLASISSDPLAYLAWSGACGTNPSTTVAQCFAALGNPVTGGAVASLEPGSGNLTQAPAPAIVDALWRAISATNTKSNERSDLDLIVRALYPSQGSATNIDAILGTPNDDIVTLASQTAGATVTASFTGLSHTDEFADPSVVASLSVAATAECWLRDPTSQTCQPAAAATAARAAPERFTPGRLRINAPTSARLGAPLTIGLSSVGVRHVHVQEIALDPRPGYKVSESEDFDVNANGGGAALNLRPSVLGPVKFVVQAEFADGTYDRASGVINVSVAPSDIVALEADADNSELTILRDGGGRMNPVAEINGLAKPVDVARFTKWRVVSPLTNPPLTLSSDGELHAIHPGAALVEGVFDGMKIVTTVTVMNH